MISCDHTNNVELNTRSATYAFGVTPEGLLAHRYFGLRPAGRSADAAIPADGSALAETPSILPAFDESPMASFTHPKGYQALEFRGWCGPDYLEPGLKVRFPDGGRDVVLAVSDIACETERVTVALGDLEHGVEVRLLYSIDPEFDVVRRRTVVKNTGARPFHIEQFGSGELTLPGADYTVTSVSGRWGGEFRLEHRPTGAGKQVFESRRGTTGHHANPWVAVHTGAGEETGGVYWVALAHSGNWRIVAEHDDARRLHVSAGLNDFDFSWELGPGEQLESPALYLGFSTGGFGGMSREMHSYARAHILPDGPGGELFDREHFAGERQSVRPVLYNSWEATYFDVTLDGQKALADVAADIGVELFVVDDGWFGRRDSDRAGLGDWSVNKDKLPGGLSPLIDYVKSLGMKFGLWVEPEMVNRDSDLFRAHPEWIYQLPGRENTEMRNQLVLNLGMPDVERFVHGTLDALLSENDISFIKWDMNRNFSEAGSVELPPERQKELWLRHVAALYRVLDSLRARHPNVAFQSCSGGGGRIDYGIFERYDQAWVSDNTDALDRLFIQHGYSQMYPVCTMEAWVTTPISFINSRSIPLRYRFHSSMCGVLGIGDRITDWDDDERALGQSLIAQYKDIRSLVQFGSLYRLHPPDSTGKAVVAFVSKDRRRAAVFAFPGRVQYGQRRMTVCLRGLIPDAHYAFSDSYDQPWARRELWAGQEPADSDPALPQSSKAAVPSLGGAFETIGFSFPVAGDYDSALFVLEATE